MQGLRERKRGSYPFPETGSLSAFGLIEEGKKKTLKCLSLVAWLLLNTHQDTASSSSQKKHDESHTIAQAFRLFFFVFFFFKFVNKKFYSVKEE